MRLRKLFILFYFVSFVAQAQTPMGLFLMEVAKKAAATPTIISVESVEQVTPDTVDYNTAAGSLTLPATLDVTYSDMSTQERSVTWDTDTYEPTTVGNQTIFGVIVLTTNEINPSFVLATATIHVRSEQLTITSLVTPTTIEVLTGTTWATLSMPDAMPSVVTANLSNATTTPIAVSWIEGSYDGDTPGDYVLAGTLGTLPENVTNPSVYAPSITVTVTGAVTGFTVVYNVGSLDVSNPVSGIYYENVSSTPASTGVKVSDAIDQNNITRTNYDFELTDIPEYTTSGTAGRADSEVYAGNASASYWATNTSNTGIIRLHVESGSFKVYTYSSYNGCCRRSNISVSADGGANTSEGVQVANNANNISEKLLFDNGGSNITATSYIDVAWTANTSGGASIGNINVIELVKVGAAVDRSIVSVESVNDYSVAYNTAFGSIGLPTDLEYTLSDASVIDIAVTWTEGSYSATTPGLYVTAGVTGSLPTGVVNPSSVQPTVNITVQEIGGDEDGVLTPIAINTLNSNPFGFMQWLPDDYTATSPATYPVIIYAPGAGERGDGSVGALNSNLLDNGLCKRLNEATWNGAQGATKFIVLTVQQSTAYWGYKGAPGGHDGIDFVEWVVNDSGLRIDTTRIYFAGFSMGSPWSWIGWTGSPASDRFAAVVGIAAAGEYVDGQTAGNRDIPVWSLRGANDGTVTSTDANRPINGFNSVSGTPAPIYENNVSGYGHSQSFVDFCTNPSKSGGNIYTWFLTYTK